MSEHQESRPLARSFSDIDLVTDRRSAAELARTLAARHYQGQRRFNALHGHARLMFAQTNGIHIDVFVEDFVMCHRLGLGARLPIHEQTIPLADLLLTKLQVAALNAKDVTDIAALLIDHDLARDESAINVDYITKLLGSDWGWWRTVTHNLHALPAMVARQLPEPAATRARDRAGRLLEEIDRVPKTLRWKARAKAGERIRWRDEPEESH